MAKPKYLGVVRVLRRHIMKGKCDLPKKCAIALALAERFPNKRVEVYDNHESKIGRYAIDLPWRIRQFIYKFDLVYSEREKMRLRLPKPFKVKLARPLSQLRAQRGNSQT